MTPAASLRRPFAAASLAALAASCTVGPNYRIAPPPTPAAFGELRSGPQAAPLSATTSEDAPLEAWWTQFHDPVLDGLVRRALAGNLDLREASALIRQAREQEAISAAGALPQVNATGAALGLSRSASAANPLSSLFSQSGSGGAGGGSSKTAGLSHLNYFNAGFDATWELDLFGGVRRGVEEARATTQAQVWRTRDTQVSVVAEVANDYLQYRDGQARLTNLHADLARQQAVLKIIGDRFGAGFVTNIDVNQQRNQLASTQSQIPQVEAMAQASLHALGVLLGETPEALAAEFGAAPSAGPPAVPPKLPVGLPSELLQRRPDIRAAERRLAAASAEIGVRTAALYPTINLIGLGAFGASDPGVLFHGSNATSLGLGMVQLPILDGGRNRANIRVARAAYAQAELEYQKTILGALRDVEDALARYSAEQRRWEALKASFGAAQNSYEIATQQYAVGLVDYTRVYDAEGSLLSNQDQLTRSDSQLAEDVVSIYKALGGGWSVRSGD